MSAGAATEADGGAGLRRPLKDRRPERIHLWAATGVFSVAVLASGVRLDPRALAAASVLGLAAVGLPHGQFDWRAARAHLSPRLGRRWPAALLSGYLGLAALTLIGWVVAPGIGLLVFLGCSVAHFGVEDVQAGAGTRLLPRAVVVAVRGGAPFVVPMLAHPKAVSWWIGEATNVSAASIGATLQGLSTWVGPLWATTAIVLLAAYLVTGRWSHAGEWVAAAVVLAVPPPVAGFLLWFLVAHSPRHLIQVARSLGDGERRGWWLRELALGGLVSAVLLGALAVLARSAPVMALQIAVAGLAAITVPHLITCALVAPAERPDRS